MQPHHSIKSQCFNSHFLLTLLFECFNPRVNLSGSCFDLKTSRNWDSDKLVMPFEPNLTTYYSMFNNAILTQYMIPTSFESMPSKKLPISVFFKVRLYLASTHKEFILSLMNQSITTITRYVCGINAFNDTGNNLFNYHVSIAVDKWESEAVMQNKWKILLKQ